MGVQGRLVSCSRATRYVRQCLLTKWLVVRGLLQGHKEGSHGADQVLEAEMVCA